MIIQFRLHEILKQKGMSVFAFAKSVRLNVSTLSRISQNQTRGITLDMMGKICKGLNIKPGELFEVIQEEDKK